MKERKAEQRREGRREEKEGKEKGRNLERVVKGEHRKGREDRGMESERQEGTE